VPDISVQVSTYVSYSSQRHGGTEGRGNQDDIPGPPAGLSTYAETAPPQTERKGRDDGIQEREGATHRPLQLQLPSVAFSCLFRLIFPLPDAGQLRWRLTETGYIEQDGMRCQGSGSILHSSYIPLREQSSYTMSPIVARLAGLSLADHFAEEGRRLPHDASAVLIRGESALNTAHLRSPNAPSTRSTGFRGIPAGGRFAFQFRQKRKVFWEWTMTSHRVASAKGVRISGQKCG
jgi:hypothetical protein